MLTWADGDAQIGTTGLYLDSRRERELSFVSHAHSDHIALHRRMISTPATAALCANRLQALGNVTSVEYRESIDLDRDTRLRLLPAGHVLGSAMLHLTRQEGSLLYTGDFRLQRDALTVEPAEPAQADFLVMETTYGLPHFIFPPRRQVIEQLIDLVRRALRDGRQPIVLGYSLGKAQEITRILTGAGVPVTLHGAAFALSRTYNQLGVALGDYRRYAAEDFHGPRALDLRQRGVLVAPPHVARTGFVTRFDNPCRIILTGWSLLKGAIYRYGVDYALPMSDHADFAELLELIERVRPKKIFTRHGYRAFAEHLRARGHDVQVAERQDQLELFDTAV